MIWYVLDSRLELTIVEARKFSGQVWVSNNWFPSMIQPNYFTKYLEILAVVLKRAGHKERRAADDCGCTSKNECLLGTHNCPVNSLCVDNENGWACLCATGFEAATGLTFLRCDDINECTI